MTRDHHVFTALLSVIPAPLVLPVRSPVRTCRLGASLASVSPQGSMPPAQLSEACAMDAETMLRLVREGWLEASPAEPPR